MITYTLSCLKEMEKDLSYLNVFDIYLSHGERTSIEFKSGGEIRKIAFCELENPVRHVADNLIEKLKTSEKGFIGLKLDNCPEWPVIFWGILMAGFKPFLIDFRHNGQLTEFLLEQTAAVAIISEEKDSKYKNVISVKAEELIRLDRKEIYELAKKERPEGSHKERIRAYKWGDEVALCTSGTTNTAKIYTYDGTAIGNQMLCGGMLVKSNERLASDREMRNLVFLPLHHIFGFLAVYMWYSFFASSMVFPDGKAPSALLAACRDHKVTGICAVPLLINNIVNGINRKLSKESGIKRAAFKAMCGVSALAQRISPEGGINVAKKLFKKSVLESIMGTSIETIISGGGHVLPDTLKKINSIGYYTCCGFGMTEVGISSVNVNYGYKSRVSGCVGVPVEAIDYRIIPIDQDNKNIGEIQIRGASIHSGRMADGKKLPPQTDEDGWFSTGDIGRLEKGALYIEGRLKEVIINESGENVYPDEIEDTFINLDGINQYTVVGIKKPGSQYEDITLVLETSNDLNDEKYKSDLINAINLRNKELLVLKKVTGVLITNEPLPLSNGIKVKRADIKKQIESNIADKYVRLK